MPLSARYTGVNIVVPCHANSSTRQAEPVPAKSLAVVIAVRSAPNYRGAHHRR